MATINSRLKGWVRYDGNDRLVAGSLVIQSSKPRVGVWREVPIDLSHSTVNCNVSYGTWKVVTGGAAGDGTVLVDDLENNEFTIIGPNDNQQDGWVYITKYYPNGATLLVDYDYTSFDENLDYDRPIYFVSATQPTGEPDNTDPKVDEIPANGTWEIIVPKGQWVAIGIYSNDSCCGRGFLSIGIDETGLITLPGEWFLLEEYSPAFTNGSITFPNHADSLADPNPNDVGQTDGDTLTQIYINAFNSSDEDFIDILSLLANNNGVLALTQGSNTVEYGFTTQAFDVLYAEIVNIIADNTFGTSVPGSITINSPASEDFNYVDPITIQLKIN